MSTSTNRRINVYINDGEAKKSLDNLKDKSERLRKEVASLTEGTKEHQERLARYNEAKGKLDSIQQEAVKLKKSMEGLNEESREYQALASIYDKVQIEARKANREVKELEINTTKLSQAQNQLGTTSKQYDDISAKIEGRVNPSMRDLRNRVSTLRRELDGLPIDTQEFIDKTKELQTVEARLQGVQNEVKDTRTSWQKFKGDIREFGMFAMGNIASEVIIATWQAVSMFVIGALDSQAKLSYEMADMQKFLGLSAEEAKNLNSELGKIKTTTSGTDLRGMAIGAGKLNVPKDEVKAFVEQMDIAQFAMQGEFAGSVEETSVLLGKLKGLFKETADIPFPDAIKKISSALLAAGASGAASGQNVADFTMRIGALGKLAPDIAQTMGIGAVLEEMGINAEIAAGGITNLMTLAGQKSKEFAAQIGMSEKAFRDLLNADPNAVILKTAESLQGLDNDQVIASLTRMGVGSQEAVKVFSALSTQLDNVKGKQALMREELDKGSKGQDAYNQRMQAFGAQYDLAKKEINAFVMSLQASLIPALTAVLETTLFLIGAIKEMPKFLRENAGLIGSIIAAFIAWNAQLLINKGVLLINNGMIAASIALDSLGITIKKAHTLATEASTNATKSSIRVKLSENIATLKNNAAEMLATSRKVASAIATKGLTIAQWALNVALDANPIGLVIVALAALAAAMFWAYNYFERFRRVIDSTWAVLKELTSVVFEFAQALYSLDITKLENLWKNAGKRIGNAFVNGWNEADVEKQKLADEALGPEGQYTSDQQIKEGKGGDYQSEESKKQAEEKAKIEEENRKRAKELGAKDSKDKKDKAAEDNKNALKDFEEFQKEIQQKQVEAEQSRMSEHERELAQIDDKYQELRVKATAHLEWAKKNNVSKVKEAEEQISAIEQMRDAEKLAAFEKFAKEKQAFEDEMLLANLVGQAKEIAETEKHYAELIAKAEKYGVDTKALEEARAKALVDIDNKYWSEQADKRLSEIKAQAELEARERKAQAELAVLKAEDGSPAEYEARLAQLKTEMELELENTELIEAEKAVIREKYRQQEKYFEMQKHLDQLNSVKEKGEMVMGIANSVFAVELGLEERKKQEKMQKLQQEYEQGLISKEQYEAKKTEYEQQSAKETAKIKRKQAQAEKLGKIFETVIATASAIMKAAPNIPLQVLQGVLGAAQVAAIVATPIPDFDSGTGSAGGSAPVVAQQAPQGGYAEGGYTGSGGKYEPAGIVHRGEYVIPNWLLRTPLVADFTSIIEGLRSQKGYAEGGEVTGSSSITNISNTVQSPENQSFGQMTMLLRQILGAVSRPSRSYVVYSDLQAMDKETQDLENEIIG